MNIEKVTLEGPHVRLEPLTPHHRAGLESAISDGELWKIPFTIVPHPEELGAFFDDAESAFQEGRELAFATIDRASGTVVGSTRFMDIKAAYLRLEIGFTFLGRSWQQTYINTEAKYLMLCHAFEHLRCNRVQLLTDVRNERSRSAIARIGARQEGILRSHMVMRDGYVRDSVVFSIVQREWSDTKRALEAKLRDA